MDKCGDENTQVLKANTPTRPAPHFCLFSLHRALDLETLSPPSLIPGRLWGIADNLAFPNLGAGPPAGTKWTEAVGRFGSPNSYAIHTGREILPMFSTTKGEKKIHRFPVSHYIQLRTRKA